jgi:ribosomal protein S18 acetylase RimI-like enzyme
MSTVRELVIRRAQEPDREWCARLMSSSEPWITLRRGLKESRAVLRRTGVELFVGREGRHRLGFILVQPYGLAGSPYVASLAVIAGARSRGVGARLMAFAEQRFAPRPAPIPLRLVFQSARPAVLPSLGLLACG